MAKNEVQLHALSQAKEHEAYFKSPAFEAEVQEAKLVHSSKLTTGENEIITEHELQELELTYD
jgi:hemin uptake protein HemP